LEVESCLLIAEERFILMATVDNLRNRGREVIFSWLLLQTELSVLMRLYIELRNFLERNNCTAVDLVCIVSI
jgi:hypothetical protein